MDLVQPKKVTGGAFGRYMAEHRAALLKECAGQAATASIKLGSERFKALNESERSKYEKMYTDAKEQYDKDMAAFLAAGGEKAAIKRKTKGDDAGGEKKKKKDPDAPKRPAGGGYGVYVNEHREEIKKSLPADHSMTDVTKVAAARWKALPDTERKPYEDKYHEKNEEYKKAMEEYKASHPEPAEEEVQSPPAKGAKRHAGEEMQKKETPAKRVKTSKGVARQAGVDIDEGVLAEARKGDLEGALKNLANRPEIVALGLKADKMLSTLKSCNGLVNSAKHALLGA